MSMGAIIFMMRCIFDISLLVELRKFYFKSAGNMLFVRMSIVCSCVLIVAEPAKCDMVTKIVTFFFFPLEIYGLKKSFVYSFLEM